MGHDEHHIRDCAKAARTARALAAGIVRRARINLGLTQAEAAKRSGCGERSQRDRELGDCNLGALESLERLAASEGLELRLVLVRPGEQVAVPSIPPSARPGLARCVEHRVSKTRRAV